VGLGGLQADPLLHQMRLNAETAPRGAKRGAFSTKNESKSGVSSRRFALFCHKARALQPFFAHLHKFPELVTASKLLLDSSLSMSQSMKVESL